MTKEEILKMTKGEKMINNLKIIGGTIALILFADIFGCMMWQASGQHPIDNFYIGTIIMHILNFKN